MKIHPLVTALLVMLLIGLMAVPITTVACQNQTAPASDKSCSIASLELDHEEDGNCPFLSALAKDDNFCTASDPASVVSVMGTIGKAIYKGARAAAITGAKVAITASTVILSGMIKLGTLMSPA